jgi:hypothetical protein
MADPSPASAPVPSSASPFDQGGDRLVFLLLGLGLFLLLVVAALRPPGLAPFALREILFLIGSALMTVGASRKLQSPGWELPDRVQKAAIVSLVGAVATILAVFGRTPDATFGLPAHWGSTRLFLGAVAIFAFGSTVLILLPTTLRKIVLVVWVFFHFGGMFTSFSSIDPPNSVGPYLSKHLWTYVYRPYLQVLYLTNAYHFYSPDPGPPALLWFAVHYDDGTYQWIRIPNREVPTIGMHYQRLLAMPEHCFTQNARFPLTRAEVAGLRRDLYPEDQIWENILERRERGSKTRYPLPRRNSRGEKSGLIPYLGDVDFPVQYRAPNDTSKKLIASIARRVIRTAPRRNGAKPTTVRMYRVIQQMLTPLEISQGQSPIEPTRYLPYFLGEFDEEGNLVDPRDPFLYWLVPILKVPSNYPDHGLSTPSGAPLVLTRLVPTTSNLEVDALEMHAAGPIKEK